MSSAAGPCQSIHRSAPPALRRLRAFGTGGVDLSPEHRQGTEPTDSRSLQPDPTGGRTHRLTGSRPHGLTGSPPHDLTASRAHGLMGSRAHGLASGGGGGGPQSPSPESQGLGSETRQLRSAAQPTAAERRGRDAHDEGLCHRISATRRLWLWKKKRQQSGRGGGQAKLAADGRRRGDAAAVTRPPPAKGRPIERAEWVGKEAGKAAGNGNVRRGGPILIAPRAPRGVLGGAARTAEG